MIVSELHSQLQMDGSVQLDCSVLDEHSVMSVVWYKNDRRVLEHKQSASQGQYSLNISNLSESHAGHYACHLVGAGGSSTTSIEISEEKIQSYMKNIKTKLAVGKEEPKVEHMEVDVPSLTLDSLPAQLEVSEGKVLSLSSSFTGNPTSVGWSLNGKALVDGDEGGRISIETTLSSSTLTVLSVSASDTGMYKLDIGSEALHEYSTANVNIV